MFLQSGIPRKSTCVDSRTLALRRASPSGSSTALTLRFVRQLSLICQPTGMAVIFPGFRKKACASHAPEGCFSSLRNVPVLFRIETRVVCNSTLTTLRAQPPRRNAVKSSLHSFRVPPVMPSGSHSVLAQSIFPCSQPLGTMIFPHDSTCVFEVACLWAHCLRAHCLRAGGGSAFDV